MSKSVLITGGAGFIGSNYVHYHIRKYPDDKITVLDKLTYAGNLPNIQELIDQKRIRFVHGGIEDMDSLRLLFEKSHFDLVINFAAETHVDRSILDPDPFVLTNIIGTHNLLKLTKEFNVKRFHQVSTDEVYGDLGDTSNTFFTEFTPLAPNCPYAATKASADILVLSYFHTYNSPVTISRCSNNYGPYQFPEKLIPLLLKKAFDNEDLPIYGDGKNIRDWLFVEDHCAAIDLIVNSDRYGEVYNIGGRNEKTNLDIAHLILNYLGKDKDHIKFVEDRKAHDRRYAIDPSKIENELGWSPKVKFEDGIRFTFDWYQINTEWINLTKNRLINFVK